MPDNLTVIECIDGIVYVYRNSAEHFKNIKKNLKGKLIKVKVMDNECDTSKWGDNWHVVVPSLALDKI